MDSRVLPEFLVPLEIRPSEAKHWDFRAPFAMLSLEESTEIPQPKESPYKHRKINEEKQGFYTYNKANYFGLRFREDRDKLRTWGEIRSSNYSEVIQPLNPKLYWHAREFIKYWYMNRDPIWSYYELDKDEESYKEIMRLIKSWLKGSVMACVFNKTKRRIDGIAVGQRNSGLYYDVKYFQKESFVGKPMRMLRLRAYVLKQILNRLSKYEKSVYITFITCVNPMLRRYKYILPMLAAGTVKAAEEMQCHYAAAVCHGDAEQKAYSHAGYETMMALPLRTWRDEGRKLYPAGHRHYGLKVFGMVRDLQEPHVCRNMFHYRERREGPAGVPDFSEEEDEDALYKYVNPVRHKFWQHY